MRSHASLRTVLAGSFIPVNAAADLLIVGGGLIGRSVALAAADRGLRVTLADTVEPGVASPAGAGMLAPAMESDGSDAERLLVAGRDCWPAYLAALEARTGIAVPLHRNGILALAADAATADRWRARSAPAPRWQDAAALAALEPGVRAPWGGVLHADDGAVDNLVLLQALDAALATTSVRRAGPAAALAQDGATVRVTLRDGTPERARQVVVAAGAWAAALRGLPRPCPVEPVRGEMLGYPVAATSRCIYGPGAYVVPRAGGRTIVGATMDRVGFDARTTPEARSALHRAVSGFLPALADVEPDQHWAGLRPVSRDGLPLLGPDPRWPAVLWAAGHSRNGILLAAMTGEAIADWATGTRPRWDLTPFRPDRFE